jgi:hypothetical protein
MVLFWNLLNTENHCFLVFYSSHTEVRENERKKETEC